VTDPAESTQSMADSEETVSAPLVLG